MRTAGPKSPAGCGGGGASGSELAGPSFSSRRASGVPGSRCVRLQVRCAAFGAAHAAMSVRGRVREKGTKKDEMGPVGRR